MAPKSRGKSTILTSTGTRKKNAASSDCPNVAGDGLRVRLNASDEDLCSAA